MAAQTDKIGVFLRVQTALRAWQDMIELKHPAVRPSPSALGTLPAALFTPLHPLGLGKCAKRQKHKKRKHDQLVHLLSPFISRGQKKTLK